MVTETLLFAGAAGGGFIVLVVVIATVVIVILCRRWVQFHFCPFFAKFFPERLPYYRPQTKFAKVMF